MLTDRQARNYLFLLIIITGLIRMVVAAYTGLGYGESYYFRGALEPALSYFDHPPLFFWLSAISIDVLGISAFAVRLPAVVLFAGSTWLIFLIGKRLFSASAGFYAALVLNLSAVFTISVGTWFQPDAPLMFFWLLTTFLIVEILFGKALSNREALIYWLLVGVSMGVTSLSKYHVVFLLLGVLLFCLFNRGYRKWVLHPGPYLALVLNLIIALPVIIWNSRQDWISFLFHVVRSGREGQFELHFEWFGRSILGQALWLLPWIWVPLVWQLWLAFKRRNQDARFSFLFWISVLPIAFFTVITLWSDPDYHFHWQAPGYLILFLLVGRQVKRNITQNIRLRRTTIIWLFSSFIFTFFSLSLLAAHTQTGIWTWYGPKWAAKRAGKDLDPTMEAYDFEQINERFDREGWLTDTSLFVGSTRWWLAGKTDWALKGEKDVLVFHPDARNYAFFMEPNKKLGKSAILISKQHYCAMDTIATAFFEEITPLDPILITRNGVEELRLDVYYGYNFRVPADTMDIPLYNLLVNQPPYQGISQ